MSASMETAPASSKPEFSPLGSIGDSARCISIRSPMGCLSSGATLTIMLLPLGRLRLALLDDLEAPLDDGQRLHEIALEANEDVGGVLVRAVHRLGRLRLCAIKE